MVAFEHQSTDLSTDSNCSVISMNLLAHEYTCFTEK